MLNISIKQAIDVWSDLEAAYYGQNDFGGTVAEIYGYRLMPYEPSIQYPDAGVREKLGVQAATSLCALLAEFKERHPDCTILVNEMPFTMAMFNLEHRCHVEIIRHEPCTMPVAAI